VNAPDISRLSMAAQLSLLVDIVQGRHRQSDAFIEAMEPLDKALNEAYAALDAAAEYHPEPCADQFWRDSQYAIDAGFGEAA